MPNDEARRTNEAPHRAAARPWVTRAETVASVVLVGAFILILAAVLIRARMAGRGVEIVHGAQSDFAYRIDVNAAGAGELMLLPGIGEARARRLLEWRARNGAFRSLEEFIKAAGLPRDDLDRIRPLVSLDSPAIEQKGR